ncbi:MAG: LapA family protein [Candidatus Uhrbacteria bacterium]|nr:LapA family protein [Candidatus Uhrbacteria bacterium]
MKNFILIVVIVMGLTFFVTSNTEPVPLHIFTLTKSIPLSFILVFPIGITLVIFGFYHLIHRRKANIVIRDLEDNLESEQEKILEIVKRTHELEIENQKLKIRLGHTDFDEDSL